MAAVEEEEKEKIKHLRFEIKQREEQSEEKTGEELITQTSSPKGEGRVFSPIFILLLSPLLSGNKCDFDVENDQPSNLLVSGAVLFLWM